MFSGVRYQVIRLAAESNKMLATVRTAPVEMPILPTVRMQKLWAEGCDV